jgi:hypothetical protein
LTFGTKYNLQALSFVANHTKVEEENQIYKETLLVQTLEELKDVGIFWDESHVGADTSLKSEFGTSIDYDKLVDLATKMKTTCTTIHRHQ